MQKIIIKSVALVFGLVSFSLSASAKQNFYAEDFYKMNRVEKRRFLGVMHKFFIDVDEVERKYSHKAKKKKRLMKYYNSFLFNMFFSVADAEGKKICVNNGVIAEIGENQCLAGRGKGKNSNWGFDMTPHLALLQEAGITSSCDGTSRQGEVPLQACGLIGLKDDLTLACSRNNTMDCKKAGGDGSNFLKLYEACVGSDGALKAEKIPNPVDKEKEISCAPLKEHFDEQLSMMNKHCNGSTAEEIGSQMAVALNAVCTETLGLYTNTVEGKIDVTGPQADTAVENLLVAGGPGVNDPNFGGALNHCLMKEKKIKGIKQIAIMPVKKDAKGKETVEVVSVEGACDMTSGAGGKKSYKCNKRTSKKIAADEGLNPFADMKDSDSALFVFGNESLSKLREITETYEEEIKAAGKVDSPKAVKAEEDRVKAIADAMGAYEKNIAAVVEQLSGSTKSCFIAAPPLYKSDDREKFASIFKESIDKANLKGTKPDRNTYCTLIDSNDHLNKIETKLATVLPRPGDKRNPAKALQEELRQGLAKEICQEVGDAGKVKSSADQVPAVENKPGDDAT